MTAKGETFSPWDPAHAATNTPLVPGVTSHATGPVILGILHPDFGQLVPLGLGTSEPSPLLRLRSGNGFPKRIHEI